MVKTLYKLFILQKDKRGRKRTNPYNPLSYMLIIFIFLFGIICFGIIGFWNEIDTGKNPFKWRL